MKEINVEANGKEMKNKMGCKKGERLKKSGRRRRRDAEKGKGSNKR